MWRTTFLLLLLLYSVEGKTSTDLLVRLSASLCSRTFINDKTTGDDLSDRFIKFKVQFKSKIIFFFFFYECLKVLHEALFLKPLSLATSAIVQCARLNAHSMLHTQFASQ